MRKGLWIMFGIALLGIALLAVMSRSLVGTVTGVDEALALQDRLRSAHLAHFVPEPPLRVFVQPGARAEGVRQWKWKVEATMRAEADASAPLVERAVQRIVVVCLDTKVAGKSPDGVSLLFHRPGKPDWERVYDTTGVPALPKPAATEAPK